MNHILKASQRKSEWAKRNFMFIKDVYGLICNYFTNMWNFQGARVRMWGVRGEGEAVWEGETEGKGQLQKPHRERVRVTGMSWRKMSRALAK